MVRRIVVLGGFGFFGGVVVKALRNEGLMPLIGSRKSKGDVIVDVEDFDSIRSALHPKDVIVDAVGPYQRRTTRLIEAAVDLGFDVVDLADSLAYVESVYELKSRIDASTSRVVTACSAMSSVSAAMLFLSGVAKPVRMSGFLVPATRYTAVAGTAASLFFSVGKPIQVYEGGKINSRIGWRSSRSFPHPQPIGTRKGYLFESVDSVTLPLLWPALKNVKFFVDTNVRGLNAAFSLATRFMILRGFSE